MVSAMDDHQLVNIEFTQEMDGQFRIELNYERIMLHGTAETSVPRIEVAEADVEHGRIAIEALSALEVQAKLVEQLSTLEINELPRQLVLKTTNPILLAYRYVKTEKPFTLAIAGYGTGKRGSTTACRVEFYTGWYGVVFYGTF